MIETLERGDQPPWIERITSTSPDIVIEGSFDLERPYAGEVVDRRYGYTVSLERTPEEDLEEELLIWSRKGGASPVLRLPVRAAVRPAVYATPPSLYASADRDGAIPPLKLSLTAVAPDFELTAEPVMDETDPIEYPSHREQCPADRLRAPADLRIHSAAQESRDLPHQSSGRQGGPRPHLPSALWSWRVSLSIEPQAGGSTLRGHQVPSNPLTSSRRSARRGP